MFPNPISSSYGDPRCGVVSDFLSTYWWFQGHLFKEKVPHENLPKTKKVGVEKVSSLKKFGLALFFGFWHLQTDSFEIP